VPLFDPVPAGSATTPGELELDGTAGDIQAVGASAAAGATGKAADAGHVHVGLKPSDNLSDVGSASTALANLGALPGYFLSKTLVSAASSITLPASGSLPAGYSLLRLVVIGASAGAAEQYKWQVTVNSTSSGYDLQEGYGSSTTAGAGVESNAGAWLPSVADMPGAGATSGVAGILDLQIPGYALTTFDKAGLWRSGYTDAATASSDQVSLHGIVSLRSGTAAITSITVSNNGGNLVAGTTAYLYLS
jgi:hypothetical protein